MMRTASAVLLAAAVCATALAQEADERDPEASPRGRDQYLGREVARTMHWRGAPWLLRETRENEENGEMLRKWLAVEKGERVCDLGCGNGYHTLPLAQAVGDEGKVYAVDLQPEMLELLATRAAEAEIEGLVTVACEIDDPKLPPDSCDLVLMVDVYHELSHPVRVLGHLSKALREGGEVVLVEFREEDRGVPIKPRHKMSKAQVVREMAANGFTFSRETDELPWQHAMSFERAELVAREDGPDALPTDHEAREFAEAFVRAARGTDPRILEGFLDRTFDLDGTQRSAREAGLLLAKEMKSGSPLLPEVSIEVRMDGENRASATLTSDMRLRRSNLTLIRRSSDSRWVVTAWGN